MSNAPTLPAAPSESTELVAVEADYEMLTEALMQTRRGRWFLAEHARRCRQMDQADLMAAFARIETALAESREPAGLTALNEKLDALARIEQALADYRDPPSIAELREGLSALPRIEQALAENPEPPGMAELREHLSAVTQSVADIRAEVIARRPADVEAADNARARDEEMLRLLQEQRERLDALADIWARVPAPPAAPAPAAPQAEPAKPDTATEPAGTVSAGVAAIAMDVSAGAAVDDTASATADVAKAAIAAAPLAADDRLDSSGGAAPERYDVDIPTSELLGRASLFALGIDSPPAEMPRDEFQPPEQPPAETPTGTYSLSCEFGGADEPAPPAKIEPAVAAAAPDDILIEPDGELPAAAVEVAPDELRLPEPAQLPAWLVGAVEPESLAGLDLRIAEEPPAAAETAAAPEPQTAPEPLAAENPMDVVATAELCDGTTILVSYTPDPESEREPVLGSEAELVLEFEAESETEPEVALVAAHDLEAECDHAPEAEAPTEANSIVECESIADASPEAGTTDAAPEQGVVLRPVIIPGIDEQDGLILEFEPESTSTSDALVLRAAELGSVPLADEVRAPATLSAQVPDPQPSPDTEVEFNPIYALAELRRILGLDPSSPADRTDIVPIDEADDAPASETLEAALANDVIEELPAPAASASQPPAGARVSRSASDPLDPVRALSEEERIALFS